MTFKRKSIFGIEYDASDAKHVRAIFLFGALILIIFFMLIIYIRFFNNDSRHLLDYEDAVVMRVNKIRNYKGFLTLNDSLIISNNVKAIVNPEYIKEEILIKYLKKPYLLNKEKNSYEFDVINNQHKYTFQLFEE